MHKLRAYQIHGMAATIQFRMFHLPYTVSINENVKTAKV
jgi:hypothetical protein